MNLSIEKGYLKKLKKVIAENNLDIKKIYSGLPSNTPNFQKTLMYGDDDYIPGFRWFDKTEGKYYTFKNPETSEYLEKMIKNKGKTGILKEGASYFNFFSGDAHRSYLTMSKIFTSSLSGKISGFKIFLIIILNVFNIIKILYRTVKEIIREFIDLLYYYLNNLNQRTLIFFPFLRIFNNVILHEYITNGVCFEIICGTPKIYVTFNSYDELAHQRGPIARSTLKTLKSIDKSIFKIYQFAKKSNLRKYDIFILSDHGAAKSYPFYKLFRKDLKDVVLKYKEHIADSNISPTTKSATINVAILEKIKLLSEKGEIPKFLSKIFPVLRLNKGKKKRIFDDFKPHKINVVSFGPVSHVYFNFNEKKLTFNEINKKYPYFIIDILAHKGIGAVIVEDAENVLLLMKHSYIKICNGKIIEGELNKIFPDEKIIFDIEKIAKLNSSGDLIVVANFLNGQIINFEDQMSCHGGIGLGQTDAFVIYPGYRKSYFSGIDTPLDMHKYFKSFY